MISITEIPPDIYRLICGYLYFNDNQLKYVNKSTINNRDFININQKLMEERLLKLKKNYNSCKISSYFKNYLRRKTGNHIILDAASFMIHDLFITNDLRPYGFLNNFNQNTRVLIPNTTEYQPYFYSRMVIYPNSDNQNQNQDKKTKKKKYKHWNYRKKKQVKDFKIKKMKVKRKSINHKKHKKSFRKR